MKKWIVLGIFAALSFWSVPIAAKTRSFLELPAEIRKEVPTGVARASKDIPDSPFGTHTVMMAEGGGNEKEMTRMVQALSEAGFKWLIDYIHVGEFGSMDLAQLQQKWPKVPPSYIFLAKKLQEAKINLLLRVDCPNWGYKITAPPTPEELKKMEHFITLMVTGLGPYCRHWQFYNEPNIGNETPQADPAAYAAWVDAFARIVRKAQPNAVIYAPGTAMLQCMAEKPYPWIDRALAAGMLKNIDVFSYHPYRQGYERMNIPEHASEFHPWNRWPSYYAQIADLRGRIRKANGGKDLPLATTEDGHPTLINAKGEQEITWIIGAKYELRKALQDFYVGVYPRTHFCFYRDMKDPFYESEASFNMITADFEKKPIYYACQNLFAVLDSTYKPLPNPPVKITLAEPNTLGQKKFQSKVSPDNLGLYVQTYTKKHPKFEELLVFFWSAEIADDVHAHHPATLRLGQSGWEAPLEIDLMAMPAPRMEGDMKNLINPEYVNRLQPRQLPAWPPGGCGAVARRGT